MACWLGKEELAKELFDEQLKQLGNLDAGKPLGRTVAFFMSAPTDM